jgi:CDP-diglyceride synthetase
MIPSLSRRLVAIGGILSALLSVYFAQWVGHRDDSGVWHIWSFLAVVALVAVRFAPSTIIDKKLLEERTSAIEISKLSSWRTIGIILGVICVFLVAAVTPFVHNIELRRVILLVILGVLMIAVLILNLVEFFFRRILRAAGIEY